MNILKIGMVSALMATLSGCLTSNALDKSIDKSLAERHVITHSDTIIAIGKPATPIKGYENALALVGEKNGYLVQPDDNNSDTLLKIFEMADLKNLSLGRYGYSLDVKQAYDDWECSSKYGCANIIVSFSKSSESISNSTKSQEEKTQDFSKLYDEKSEMEKLGFDCKMYYEAHVILSCYYSEKLAFTITEPVTNPSQLTHKLSKPVAVRFYTFDADHDKKEIAIKKFLKPIAFAFDVATFPIQMMIWDPKK